MQWLRDNQRSIVVALVVVAVAAVIGWGLKSLFSGAKTGKPSAQQITLVKPNLPPPPPPKPPEKLPEPPKVKEEVKVEQPKEAPKSADPPPAGRLGLDAQGSGSGDGFGLGANPGGRDITVGGDKGGLGSGSARLQFAFYRDVVVRHVNDSLNRVDELKASGGQIAMQVWIDRLGRIERVEVRDATREQIELIRRALVSGRALREPPPDAMPQPVWIELNLREIG